MGLSNLSVIASTVMSNKEKLPKELMTSILQNAINGANVLGDQFQSISKERRWDIKKFLNPEYSGICSAQVCCIC